MNINKLYLLLILAVMRVCQNTKPKGEILRLSSKGLLLSRDGVNVEQRYFAHNDAESQYHFSPSPQTFSYNDSVVYYCR